MPINLNKLKDKTRECTTEVLIHMAYMLKNEQDFPKPIIRAIVLDIFEGRE